MQHSYLRNMAQFRVEDPEGFEKYFEYRFEKLYGLNKIKSEVKNSFLDSIVGSVKKAYSSLKEGSDFSVQGFEKKSDGSIGFKKQSESSIGFKKVPGVSIGFTRQGYDSQGLVKYR